MMNFSFLKYAKSKEYLSGEFLEKSNKASVLIANVEKAMSREEDIFENEHFFTNEPNEETDGIYFLSHKFPCFDCVIKSEKDIGIARSVSACCAMTDAADPSTGTCLATSA